MYTVNVFTAELSLPWVQRLEEMKPSLCEFHYYAYTDFEELYMLLEEHLTAGDGALFSGQIPYFFAQTHFQKQLCQCFISIFQNVIFTVP